MKALKSRSQPRKELTDALFKKDRVVYAIRLSLRSSQRRTRISWPLPAFLAAGTRKVAISNHRILDIAPQRPCSRTGISGPRRQHCNAIPDQKPSTLHASIFSLPGSHLSLGYKPRHKALSEIKAMLFSILGLVCR